MKNIEKLIAVARGQQAADVVLKNARIFNSFSGEFEHADLAIADEYIAGIGKYRGLTEYDLGGRYVTPGFVDAHVHIESSMLRPEEFAKVLLMNGTTSIFADPHEIVNVMGTAGMDYMLQATENLPVDVYFTLPSCVPASPFETAAAQFDVPEFAPYYKHPRVVGLGEMMNFPGVLNTDAGVIARLKSCSLVDGHAPTVSGHDLNAYIAAGVSSDHEAFTAAEAREKLERGMYIYMREGSAAKNLQDLLSAVTEYNYRRICLATDDRHLDELVEAGGINNAVRMVVQGGVSLGYAINMASLNTFERFGIKERGALAPGYRADLLVFDSRTEYKPQTVIKDGRIVVDERELVWKQAVELVQPQINELHIPQQLDLFIADKYQTGLANVIKTFTGQLVTEKWQTVVPTKRGGFVADSERDIQKIAVVESHVNSGNIGLGLISIAGMKCGALASTVAHDAHNLVTVGTNDIDMLLAIAELKKMGGGLAVVKDAKVLAKMPLPVAGLMSNSDYLTVLEQLKQIDQAAYSLGIAKDINPFMLLSFACLSVIPALKLTDKGLVDVDKFEFIEVAVSGDLNS